MTHRHGRQLDSSHQKWHTNDQNRKEVTSGEQKASVARYAGSDSEGARKPSDRVIGFVGILRSDATSSSKVVPRVAALPIDASRRRDLYRRQRPVELSVTDRRMLVSGRNPG